jgi:UDP-N-acetylglucosamine--N-acetylmuramyl-(pentapeptide) pyrophosphoryl-undecaprenol N-acetylglucosamine transferase
MSGLRILIMAGGTGGHVFPALAVARELRERGHEVSWLGTQRGLEAELVPQAGFPIDYISIAGLRGKGLTGWLLAPWRLSVALFQALAILRRRRPAMVLGMGGFVTGPGGVAARLSGRPLVIHEQNAIAGLTNRLLSHLAQMVLEAFPDTFAGGHVRFTGNPVRGDIMQVAEPDVRYATHSGPIRLFVLGGSLGAMVFNQTLPKALALLPEAIRPQVRHQTGKKHLQATEASYDEAGVTAELLPFIDDMAAMYEWADLVLCRSGALTVSELAIAGVPALLVPFPFAVDDHQSANGRYLADEGAAQLIPQNTLNEESLAGMIREYCAEPEQGREKLREMAKRARMLARPEATNDVVAACLEAAIEERAA